MSKDCKNTLRTRTKEYASLQPARPIQRCDKEKGVWDDAPLGLEQNRLLYLGYLSVVLLQSGWLDKCMHCPDPKTSLS